MSIIKRISLTQHLEAPSFSFNRAHPLEVQEILSSFDPLQRSFFLVDNSPHQSCLTLWWSSFQCNAQTYWRICHALIRGNRSYLPVHYKIILAKTWSDKEIISHREFHQWVFLWTTVNSNAAFPKLPRAAPNFKVVTSIAHRPLPWELLFSII